MNKDLELKCLGRSGQFPLLQALVDELVAGTAIMADIDDLHYRRPANGSGSVGGQFRHDLDIVNCFLKGLDDGRIDYAQRERDLRVEQDREYALERFRALISRIERVPTRQFSKSLLVRSEVDRASWLPSSFVREAEFVYSHTVHHHALIAEKLAGYGINIGTNFGVARSTLTYWDRKAA